MVKTFAVKMDDLTIYRKDKTAGFNSIAQLVLYYIRRASSQKQELGKFLLDPLAAFFCKSLHP